MILVDEADRLHMNSLEQIRSIFDEGTAGLVLIGMPGIERRIARFPQFYSRIGFVHEFRPLDAAQLQQLLESRWAPTGVKLPAEQLVPEVIASLIRMTGGNFRLLARLLTQIERVLDVNELPFITNAIVEAIFGVMFRNYLAHSDLFTLARSQGCRELRSKLQSNELAR